MIAVASLGSVTSRPAIEPFDLAPTRPPDEAGRAGRYALENDEHIDVLVAGSVTTADGPMFEFETVWTRRQSVALGNGTTIAIPSIDDLILTKQIQPRPKDLEDIRLLQALRREAAQ